MITYFILLMISPFIRTGMSLDHHFASQSQNTAQLDAKKKNIILAYEAVRILN